MKILISDAFASTLPDQLARFGEVTDDHGQVADAEVVLIRSKTKCTREYIDEAKKLKLIIRGGVGLDNVDLVYAKEKGVIVRNTAAASSVAVAELAIALMIAVPCRIVEGHNTMTAGEWAKKKLKRTELFRKTLGLLGAGRIGVETGMRASALGMNVIAYDPFVKKTPVAEMVTDLDEFYSKCDYLSLHMPLTDDTKGMLNKSAFAKMKDGVVIVNTGRGKCVHEEDMVEALNSGKVGHYATDVWYSDPPQDSPLTSATNVLMTPHIGASTKENMDRIGEIVLQLIEDYQNGKLEL